LKTIGKYTLKHIAKTFSLVSSYQLAKDLSPGKMTRRPCGQSPPPDIRFFSVSE